MIESTPMGVEHTDKAILVLTNQTTHFSKETPLLDGAAERERTDQRRSSNNMVEQVQSSSSTTPHIKLENPTFNSNSNKVAVIDLHLV